MPRQLTTQQRRVARLARKYGIMGLSDTKLRSNGWKLSQLLSELSEEDLGELEECLETLGELQASLRCLN